MKNLIKRVYDAIFRDEQRELIIIKLEMILAAHNAQTRQESERILFKLKHV